MKIRDHYFPAARLANPYSSSIEAAWEVVEALRKHGWLVVVKTIPEGFPWRGEHESEQWHARVCVELHWVSIFGIKGIVDQPEDLQRRAFRHPFALADTMPEAVCKVALEVAEAFC